MANFPFQGQSPDDGGAWDEQLKQYIDATAGSGTPGADGPPGEGVPTGGTTGQALVKASNTDFDTEWADETGGVTSVNTHTGAVVLGAADVGADASGAAAAAQAASQPVDSDLTAIAALTTTSFGRALLTLADAAAGRTSLGLGTAATQASSAFDTAGAAAAAQAASQPVDSDLTAIAALTTTSFGRGLLAAANGAALGITASDVGAQPLDSDLTAIAALSTTAYGRALLTVANLAALQAILGTGTPSSSTFLRGDGTWATTPAGADKLGLTPTAAKTANYTAAVGDLVPCDTTSGAFTVTLPTAPADGSVIAIKVVAPSPAVNAVTYACGGSDVFNRAGGGTTGTLALVGQSALLQYKTTGAIWYVVVTDVPLAQLDLRYQRVISGADGQVAKFSGGVLVAAPFTRPVYGGVVAEGDSFTQLPGVSGGGGGIETNFAHITAAWCGISEGEVTLWGSSGAAAALVNDATLLQTGSGRLVRHHVPPHWESRNTSATAYISSKARKALTLLSFILNDLALDRNAAINQINNAMLNGYRTMISKVRAARQWDAADATITYAQGGGGSNGWAVGAGRTYFPSNGTYWSTVINGNTATWTLPSNMRNGTVALLFQGYPGAYAQLAAGSSGAVNPTTVTVDDASVFATADTLYFPLAGGGYVKAAYTSKSGNVLTLGSAISGTLAATGAQVTRGAPITTLAAASSGAAGTSGTITVADTTYFTTTGSIVLRLAGGKSITIAYAGKTGTTFTGCTGGSGTLPPTGAIVQQDDGMGLTFTGTAAAAGGRVLLGGQGCGNSPAGGNFCHVVARFPVTGADSGKTFIATLSNLISGSERFVSGGWWIEDDEPPAVVLPTRPRFSYAGYTGGDSTPIDTLNNAVKALATNDFDSAVFVADYAAKFASLYGAVIKTDPSTGTTVDITPNDPTNCLIAVGSGLRCQGEEMLVTAVDKATISPDWRLTCTRATSPEGASAGGNAARAAGTGIFDAAAFSPGDRIHPSERGHQLIASTIIDALSAYVQTSNQQANSGGLVARPKPRLAPGGWVGPRSTVARQAIAGSLSAISAIDRVHCWRVEIPEECFVTSLNARVITNFAAGGLLQMGIWADGAGRPGSVIYDTGTVAVDTGSTPRIQSFAAWKKLRPQWVWIGWVIHGNVSTGRMESIDTPWYGTNLIQATSVLQPTSAYLDPTCFHFPASAGSLPNGTATLNELTGLVPWMWLGIDVALRD